MEFDKSRVYTALNADELQVGSKCVFADTVEDLRKKVQGGFLSGDAGPEDYLCRLVEVYDDSRVERFISDCHDAYLLAYLIEPPKEPQYKPFSSMEKAKEAIDKHGGFVRHEETGFLLLTVGFTLAGVFLGNDYNYSFKELFHEFTFADDGSPCGELVEE